MKRGCSLSVIVLFVILSAGLYYVLKTRGKDILEPAKEKFKQEIVNQIVENLSRKISSTGENSAKRNLGELKLWVQKQGDKLDLKELKNISDEVAKLLKKKVVNSESIRKIQEEIKNYEKSKEN